MNEALTQKKRTDSIPEPSLKDLVNHKMKQALKAFDLGMFAEFLDMIDYTELHLADPCLNPPTKPKMTAPLGTNFLRAKARLQFGKKVEVPSAVRRELEVYLDNTADIRFTKHLEVLIAKRLQESQRAPSLCDPSAVQSCNVRYQK